MKETIAPHMSALINCLFWAPGDPRILSNEDLDKEKFVRKAYFAQFLLKNSIFYSNKFGPMIKQIVLRRWQNEVATNTQNIVACLNKLRKTFNLPVILHFVLTFVLIIVSYFLSYYNLRSYFNCIFSLRSLCGYESSVKNRRKPNLVFSWKGRASLARL